MERSYQNFSTPGTGLRALLRDVQGVEGSKEQFPSQCFCKEKGNTKKYQNVIFGDGQ
jgi:hypothetical protein